MNLSLFVSLFVCFSSLFSFLLWCKLVKALRTFDNCWTKQPPTLVRLVPLASHSLSLSHTHTLSLSLAHTHTLCGAFIICFSQAMLVWLLLLCLVHMCVHARSQKLSPERCHEMDAVLERLEHHPDASLIDPLRVLQEAHAIVCQQPQLPPPRQNAPTNHALTPSKHTRSHDHSGEHRYGSDNNNNLNNLTTTTT